MGADSRTRALHNLACLLNARFHGRLVRSAGDLPPGVLLYDPKLFGKHLDL